MASTLSPHDASILSSLFTNEPPQISIPKPTPSLPPTLLAIRKREASAIAPLNVEKPSEEVIQKAISELSSLIAEHDDYASAYNNRAQARRLVMGDCMTIDGASKSWEDLWICVKLCSAQPEDQVDEKLLGAAYTQMGVLLLATAKTIKAYPAFSTQLPEELKSLSAEELEHEAENKFKKGAKCGDEAAKMMVVHLNPMRKLCGQMVREALRRDMEESGVFKDRPEGVVRDD